MDIEPGTSSEADKSDTAASCSERKYNGGGTTCCIPTCSSNTKRNPDLSFYRIPTDKKHSERCGCTGLDELIFNQTTITEFVPSILWVARGRVFTTYQL